MLRRKKIAAVILCAVFSFNFINGIRVYAADNNENQTVASLEDSSSEDKVGETAADTVQGQDVPEAGGVEGSTEYPEPEAPGPLPNPGDFIGLGIPDDADVTDGEGKDEAGDSEGTAGGSNTSDVQGTEDSSEESDGVIWGEGEEAKWYNNACYMNDIKFVKQDDNTVAIDDDIDSALNNSLEGDLVLPEKIKIAGKYYTVSSIQGYAFMETGDLTSITLPKTITSMQSGTFAFGDKLQNIYVDSENPMYSDVDGVLFNKEKTELLKYPEAKEETSYAIPDSVTSIADYAFNGNKNLTSVDIPDCVSSMGWLTFGNCSNLTDIKIPSSMDTISSSLFEDCDSLESIVIPDNITKIGKSAFSCCSKLKNVTLGSNIKEIGEDAFFYDRNLESIDMPDSVTSIGKWAFNGCTNLKSVRLSNNLTKLTDEVFEDCSSLESINIPAAMTDFGENTLSCSDGFHTIITENVFSGCNSLKEICVDQDNPKYIDVDGIVFSKDMTKLIKYPAGKEDTEYIVPDTVKTIQSYAFYEAQNLQSVVFPDSVTYIQDEAFYKCPNLRAVTLPSSIERMGFDVFCMCSHLNTILASDNMNNVGFNGFRYCDGISNFWMSPEQYEKAKRIGCPYNKNIVCSYKDDVMKIKADSVKCFEKHSDGTVEEVALTLDSDGYYVNNPSKDWDGTKYFYYEAKLGKKTYVSPLTAVKGNGKTETETPVTSEEAVWDNNNECVINGIKYRYNQEDYVWAAGVTDDSENITIPSKVTVDGKLYRVSAISVGAFKDCTNLKNVTIAPEGGSYNMYYINADAFSGCSNLQSVTIPDTVAGIGNGAFEGCNMDNLTFILNNESTRNVLSASGIVSNNVVVK